MKAIVVYYSLDGNSHVIAERIKSTLGADTLKLELVESMPKQGFMKMFQGGKQALFGTMPALKPYRLDLDQYELLILGGPVWAGSPAPALMSFLQQTKFSGKKAALFCCHAGGKGMTFSKLRDALKDNTILGEIDFPNAGKQDTQELNAKLDAWLKDISAR
ncbi:MAG: flavodoxin [Treponema sp.]|jgi:flavodoxin|nr:flavodoxin [Treponema sp.]